MRRQRATVLAACICTVFVLFGPMRWHSTLSQSSAHVEKDAEVSRSIAEYATPVQVERQDYTELAAKFQDRVDTIHKHCPHWKDASSKKPWRFNTNFLIHYNRRLLLCAVPKAGSTSWHMLLWAMRRQEAGLSTDRSLYTYEDTKKNHETSKNLTFAQGTELTRYHDGDDDMFQEPPTHKSKRVILTRHPFARLISGWHQKFLPDSPYADLMLQRYSKLKSYMRIKDPNHRIAWKDFAEFTAEYGTSVSLLDYHFKPVWSLCEPCEYAYSYIVKSETADRDESWLLTRLNITDVKLGRHGVPPGGSLVNSNPSDKIKFYFAQLSDQTRRKLYKIYEKDFKVFGYTFDFETLESGGFD